LDDVTEQGDLCVAAMVDHPFDTKCSIMATDEYFAQFT
jgi:hypothetical protein